MKTILYSGLTFILALLFACVGEDFVEDANLLNERLSIVSSNTGTDILVVGDSVTYQAKYFNRMGEEEPRTFVWTSSRPDIVSIDANGKAIGIKVGASNIQVSSGDLSDSRLVIVQAVERVEITAANASIVQGDSLQLQAKYYDNQGNAQVVSFQWSSDNTTVLSVDNNGKVKAIAVGSAGITASYMNSSGAMLSNRIEMAVISDSSALAQIDIFADTNQLEVNDTLRFTATVKNLRGDVLTNHPPLNWTTSDAAVLSIDGSGLATAASIGAADISATIGNVRSNLFNVLVSQAMQSNRTGTFRNRNGYQTKGTVTLSVKTNGGLKLDFGSDFETNNGPGLYIHLGTNNNNGIEIQKLNQTKGSFSVDLPSNISIDDYDYVIIYCKLVRQPFGSAKLN